MRIPDDRPKDWRSPDGRSYWEHAARHADELRDGGQPTLLLTLIYSAIGSALLVLLAARW